MKHDNKYEKNLKLLNRKTFLAFTIFFLFFLFLFPFLSSIVVCSNQTQLANNGLRCDQDLSMGNFSISGTDVTLNFPTTEGAQLTNVATTSRLLSISGMNNTLIFYSNGTVWNNTNLSRNDGTLSQTVSSAQNVTILNNYNLTYQSKRTNEPFGIIKIDNDEYHVTNVLTNTVKGFPIIITDTSCSLIGGVKYRPDSLSIPNAIDFTCSGNTLTIPSVDNIEPSTSSNVILLDLQSGGGGGGGTGSSGGDGGIDLSKLDSRICNVTYPHLLTYGEEFSKINFLKDDLEDDGIIIDFNTLRNDYVEHFQNGCSEIINRTLEPESVCLEIFLYINEAGYSNLSLDEKDFLQDKLSEKVNISDHLITYYINNYNNLCPDFTEEALRKRGKEGPSGEDGESFVDKYKYVLVVLGGAMAVFETHRRRKKRKKAKKSS